ncbi:hypothetical protein EXN32_22450 [Agrobacterium tumefaciens]|uniref:hypothetical protein n=1 Tax=Agrobacterium TaxID=357 RepID=UPI00115D1567|nr:MULTISPECIES: hypothetical protein [Agrobacterium]MDA5241022.1 hypothetical protein [Agrobacterium sp. MAFF310724]MDA5249746.1 hypothetical protein [Agrobacterium sp. MAFF210268]TRB12248.1 hypothetical protein EXN32_22450 [Agrobacterium tumefaciens]
MRRRTPLPTNITDKIISLTNASQIKELSDIYAVVWFDGLTEQDHADIFAIAPASKKIRTLYADITDGVVTRRIVGKVDWQENEHAHIYVIPKVYLSKTEIRPELLGWIYGDVAVFSRHTGHAPITGKGLAWDDSKQNIITRDIRVTDKVMTHSGSAIYARHFLEDRGDSEVLLIPASFENRHLPKIPNFKTKSDYVLTQATAWIIHDGTIIAHLEDHKTRRQDSNIRQLYLRTKKKIKRGDISHEDVCLTDIEEDNKPSNIYQLLVNTAELKLIKNQKNKRPLVWPYRLDHLTNIVGIDPLNPPDYYDRLKTLRKQKEEATNNQSKTLTDTTIGYG